MSSVQNAASARRPIVEPFVHDIFGIALSAEAKSFHKQPHQMLPSSTVFPRRPASQTLSVGNNAHVAGRAGVFLVKLTGDCRIISQAGGAGRSLLSCESPGKAFSNCELAMAALGGGA